MIKESRYNWRSSWRWSYESIWSSLEKFKYANELTGLDIYKMIHASSRKKATFIYTSIYGSKQYIDDKCIFDLLKIHLFEESELELKYFLGPLFNEMNMEKCMVTTWRYCPECIKLGYHSILHQLNLFDKCIYHGIELKINCPFCSKAKPYLIDFKTKEKAFECNCGYDYLENKDYTTVFENWNSVSKLELFNNTGNIYLSKLSSDKSLILSYDYFKNKYIKGEVNHEMSNSFIFNMLINRDIDKFYISKFSPGVKESYKYDDIYDYLGLLFMDQYMNIFKSIARHIRKNIKNINHIKFFTKRYIFFRQPIENEKYLDGLCNKDISEELYAYIMFRKFFEGHERYNDIHVYLPRQNTKDSQYNIRMNISKTIVYKFISTELSKYLLISKSKCNGKDLFDDYSIIISAYERILSYIFIEYYNKCIKYIRYMKCRYPNKQIDFTAEIPIDVPDYLIYFKKCEDKCYIIPYKNI